MMLRLTLLLLALLLCGAAVPPPADLGQRAGFDQKLGATLPLHVQMQDADGVNASLGQRLHGRPAVIALGYFACDHLCDTVTQSLAHAVARTGMQPGRDMEVMFLSIDPHEGVADAVAALRRVESAEPAAHASQWQFLHADADAVRETAHALGFRYYRDERLHEYVHPAGVIVLTPEGRISQYLFGVEYQPQTLRLALVDASHGSIGTLTDRLVLLCCGYDPSTGRYSLLIGKTMRVVGIAFAALLVSALAWTVWRRRA